MEKATSAQAARRPACARALLAALLAVALGGCNHMNAEGAKPEIERGGGNGGNGGY